MESRKKITVGLQIGDVLRERYRVDAVVGMGGFGITYRAWDLMFECQVAVKEYFPTGVVTRTEKKTVSVLSEDLQRDMEHGIKRFLQEARDVARFANNPGVVSVKDFFRENGTAYMVMEFLDGCTLKEYLAGNGGQIDDAMSIQVIFSLMKVLEEVHAAGVVHRDISPDNVYICNDRTIKLIDFGAAKIVSGDVNSASVVLKQGYAPVEQYSKKGNIGPWTDVYAFGALMYYMMTGKRPEESVERVIEDDLVTPITLNPKVSENMSRVIMKALSVRPEDRYQNMGEMRTDFLQGEGDASLLKAAEAAGVIPDAPAQQTQPQMTQTQATQPQMTQTQATQPQQTQPQTTQAQQTQPQMTQAAQPQQTTIHPQPQQMAQQPQRQTTIRPQPQQMTQRPVQPQAAQRPAPQQVTQRPPQRPVQQRPQPAPAAPAGGGGGSNKKLILIAAIIAVVFVVGVLLVSLAIKSKKSSDSGTSAKSGGEVSTSRSATEKKTTEKKTTEKKTEQKTTEKKTTEKKTEQKTETASGLTVTSLDGLETQTITKKDKIYVYSWDSDLETKLNIVLKAHPELKDYVIYKNLGVGSADALGLIDSALNSGKEYPSIFAGEVSYAKYWVKDETRTMDLSTIGLTVDKYGNSYQFAQQFGTYNNKLKAVTWQTCPGSVFYNRKIAKEVFGTDDPEQIQALLQDWDSFFAAAEKLKKKGYKIVSGPDDVMHAILNSHDEPWVDTTSSGSGTFLADYSMEQYAEIAKKLSDGGYTAGTTMWDADWSANMQDGHDVFCYFACPWMISVFQSNGATDGSWGAVVGPTSYYWGGTYLCVGKETPNPELCEFLLYELTCDTDIAVYITNITGDSVNNIEANQRLIAGELSADNAGVAFLGGQNPYDTWDTAAFGINQQSITEYDYFYEVYAQNAVYSYISGDLKSVDEVIAYIRQRSKEELGIP